jgi:hypothetical protein
VIFLRKDSQMPPEKKKDIPPRCLNLAEAAAYFGVGYNSFLTMVKRGHAPPPIVIPGRTRRIWDREQLDRAVDRLRDGVAA